MIEMSLPEVAEVVGGVAHGDAGERIPALDRVGLEPRHLLRRRAALRHPDPEDHRLPLG